MSALESSAKPVLLTLLKRNQSTLSPQASSALARWVAVKSIVGEHATEATALTPPTERRAVHERSAIPAFFRIFVAYHSLRTQTAYYRDSTTVSKSARGPDPGLPSGIQRNIQATTFLVGPLCFYVAAARVEGLSVVALDPNHPMHRLWPDPDAYLDFNTLPVLAQPDLFAISRSLERLVGDPRVIFAGPLPEQEYGAT
jgi:hypothetical protein